jgi:hypothetical protein
MVVFMRIEGKYKTMRSLFLRLKKEGIIGYGRINTFRDRWLYKLEKEGRLVCPKSTVDNRTRLFTEEQINEIVTAFTPGTGSGNWTYKK